LLAHIASHLPDEINRYYEPFIGGGACFFRFAPPTATLGDANPELVHCWTMVRDRPDELIEALRVHVYEKDYYYSVRAIQPGDLPPIERAARTVFLNRTGFNGLYRVNKSGGFNVPFGRYTNPLICDETNIRACSEFLQETDLRCGDFETAVKDAGEGDFVYFDPPYIPVSATANFTDYRPGGFGRTEHDRLAATFERLAQRGVKVVLSNSDAPGVRGLYEGLKAPNLQVHVVRAGRSINSKATRRGKVNELLVTAG
jgi:DNA adenine methylase